VCGACSHAVRIETEKKGSYLYWFSYHKGANVDAGRQYTGIMEFKGKSTTTGDDTPVFGLPGVKLHVLDKRAGLLAVVYFKPARDAKSEKPIKLSSDDFVYAPWVKLRVISEDGAPIESALVDIIDGEGRPMTAVITPVDKGVAVFGGVAVGEINVKVRAEGVKRTIDSDIEMPVNGKSGIFERDIRVKGDIDTITPTSEDQPRAAKPKHSAGGGVFQAVSALLFIGLIVAIAVAVAKSRGLTAERALRQLGVSFPQDSVDAASQVAPAPADPNMCEFCGQAKNSAGLCACAVTPGGEPVATPTQASTGPRLIGVQGAYANSVFEIAGASVVIGREPGNDIALVSDSTASRRHATITVPGGDYAIKDEGSSNGTLVNSARVTEQRLSPGDEITIGGTKFRFEKE